MFMLKLVTLICCVCLPVMVFSQVNNDSLNWEKSKKNCNITEFADNDWGFYFGTSGQFIKGYSISSPDEMIDFYLGMSTTDTVYKMKIKAYGNSWVSNPYGVEAIDESNTVSISDVPVTIQYNKVKKRYTYTAEIVVHRPFVTYDDRELASKMLTLSRCSVYKVYIFTHQFKYGTAFYDCVNEVLIQKLDKQQREQIKLKRYEEHEHCESMMKEARRLDAERAKKSKPKKKN